MEIISREAGIPLENITKKGGASYILAHSIPAAQGSANV